MLKIHLKYVSLFLSYILVISLTVGFSRDHSRLNSQNDWGGGLYDHLMSTRIITLIINTIIVRALKIMRQMTMGTIWIRLSPYTNCRVHIIQRVGEERKYPS